MKLVTRIPNFNQIIDNKTIKQKFRHLSDNCCPDSRPDPPSLSDLSSLGQTLCPVICLSSHYILTTSEKTILRVHSVKRSNEK